MTSSKEFGKMLDQIPIDAPYEIIQKLREAHGHIHTTTTVNEDLPYTFEIGPDSGDDDIRNLANSIINMRPTHLRHNIQMTWKK